MNEFLKQQSVLLAHIERCVAELGNATQGAPILEGIYAAHIEALTKAKQALQEVTVRFQGLQYYAQTGQPQGVDAKLLSEIPPQLAPSGAAIVEAFLTLDSPVQCFFYERRRQLGLVIAQITNDLKQRSVTDPEAFNQDMETIKQAIEYVSTSVFTELPSHSQEPPPQEEKKQFDLLSMAIGAGATYYATQQGWIDPS